MPSSLQLEPGTWYVWQMFPGYTSEPYLSPILIRRVTPLKTGAGMLEVEFYNAFYAEGVREFTQRLRILVRGENYLMARIEQPGGDQRACVITELTPWWVQALLPDLAARWPGGASGDLQAEVQRALLGG